MRIILLNGPPRSGKDTFGGLLKMRLEATGYTAGIFKFANCLKRATHRLYGLPEDAAHLEAVKDSPHAAMLGVTPRQAYIAVSERLFKPLYGNGVYGSILADELRQSGVGVAIVTDSGFAEEAQELINAFGTDGMLLLWMRRSGCDFANDSRSYIELKDVLTISIFNNGTIEDLSHLATGIVRGLVA